MKDEVNMKKDVMKDSNKRVLHLLKSNQFSGAENVAIMIIKGTKNRFGIEGIYVSPNGPISTALNENHVKFEPLSKFSIINVRRAVKKYKPDIIHAHDFTASIVAAFSLSGIPIISHLHNNSPWIKGLNFKSLIYRISSVFLTEIICVSKAIIMEYRFAKSISKKTHVLTNCIEFSSLIEKSSLETAPDGIFDVVFIGRLTKLKNPVYFIEIIKSAVMKIPNLRVAMIGNGELIDDCQNLIENFGLEDNIKVLGFLNNPYGILSKSKMLCITSDWEGFGLVALEAMALEVPVLAKPVGGLTGIVNSQCGKLCNHKDEFVDEICKLLNDSEYRALKSKSAKQRFNELNNEDEYMNEICNLYCSILKLRKNI